jgi:hypothetical protein
MMPVFSMPMMCLCVCGLPNDFLINTRIFINFSVNMTEFVHFGGENSF